VTQSKGLVAEPPVVLSEPTSVIPDPPASVSVDERDRPTKAPATLTRDARVVGSDSCFLARCDTVDVCHVVSTMIRNVPVCIVTPPSEDHALHMTHRLIAGVVDVDVWSKVGPPTLSHDGVVADVDMPHTERYTRRLISDSLKPTSSLLYDSEKHGNRGDNCRDGSSDR
jgi:hypothetical protein